MMKKIVGSVDRISGTTAYIVLNDDAHVLPFPSALLPGDVHEGSAYTITIECNEEEERRLSSEIAAFRKKLND